MKFASIFSDNMILQRNKPTSIWGWADAGLSVTLNFKSQYAAATADSTEKWTGTFQSLESGDGLTLTVTQRFY